MGKIITREITGRKEWEEFLKLHKEANFLQSWQWGEFHEALHHKIIRTGFYDKEKLVGVMLSIVERAKRATYVTVPAGPIINWQDKAQVNEFRNAIVKIAKTNNCSFIRVRPQLLSNDFSNKLFMSLRFKPFKLLNGVFHILWQFDP